jgi:hypothetical protein
MTHLPVVEFWGGPDDGLSFECEPLAVTGEPMSTYKELYRLRTCVRHAHDASICHVRYEWREAP